MTGTDRVASVVLTALAALALVGCAPVNPGAAFESTRDMLADRHPGTAAWLRDDAARAAAEARAAELLAAPLTLDRAAELALLRNPGLQATLENLGIAQADLAQASRLANPGISFSRLSGDGATQRTVVVAGDVVDWLVQPLRKRVAAAELERTKLEVGQALLDVVAEAREALLHYQSAVLLADRLAVVEEIDRAAADYAQALFDAGNLTALERANAEAGWGETRAELERARLEAARAREEVVRAIGLTGTEPWTSAPALPAPDLEAPDPDALQRTALEERFDVLAARWAVTALEHALTLKRRTRFSPVGVELGVERERETDGAKITGPIVELRLPVFDTGKASVARLRSELAQARWQQAALEGAVRSEVRERTTELAAARKLYELYRDTVLPLRREVLDRTLREYNQMLVGTFDVLVARQQVIEAERRSIEALALYWEARVALDRATGGRLPLQVEAGPAEPAPDPPPGQEHHEHRDHGHHGAAAAGGTENAP